MPDGNVDFPQFSSQPNLIDATNLIEQDTRRSAVKDEFRAAAR
jgi:hypothetical protein